MQERQKNRKLYFEELSITSKKYYIPYISKFKKIKEGMNILGDRNTLKNLKRESILDYYNEYYVPNNSIISICGNFKFEEIVKQIEEKFKTWQPKSVDTSTTKPNFNPCIVKKKKA